METKKTWCVVFHRFPKLHNQQKKQLYFYTPENVNNLKKKSGYETLTDCLLSHDFSKGTKRATDKSKQILKAKAAGAEDGSLMKMKRKVQRQETAEQTAAEWERANIITGAMKP